MLLLILAAAAGGGFVLVGSRSRAAASATAAAASAMRNRVVPVLTAEVTQRDVPMWREGLGSVAAFYTVTVKTQVDGRIDRVAFTEGQHVKKGDLLVQIDPARSRSSSPPPRPRWPRTPPTRRTPASTPSATRR